MSARLFAFAVALFVAWPLLAAGPVAQVESPGKVLGVEVSLDNDGRVAYAV